MALNYAEVYSPNLLEIIMDGAYTSPFITSNVAWMNAKTFHFTQMSVSGYKNHSRDPGWNSGTIDQKDVAYTVAHDRDIQFLVDKVDVDETARTSAVANVSKTFVMTQQTPEVDAVFFEAVHTAADDAGLTEAVQLSAFTTANILEMLKSYINKVRMYKNKGLILYIKPELMDLLELADNFTRIIESTTISESGKGIETRVTSLDGVPMMEIVDTDRFCTKFDYSEGFVMDDTDGAELLVVACTPMTTKTVPKIESIYYFNAGTHTEGDGDLYQNRSLWDTFVFPNGKNGEVDSVYTVTQEEEDSVYTVTQEEEDSVYTVTQEEEDDEDDEDDSDE